MNTDNASASDVLKDLGTDSRMRWQCPDCARTLPTTDWTYADLAERGIPVCGHCDRDMELMKPSDKPGGADRAPNAWIIVDSDERGVIPCVYDNYEECAGDANAMDNSLTLGIVLPDRRNERK